MAEDFRILAVDDEVDFLDTIRRGLVISGYRDIHLAPDADTALELMEKGERFDIALIDITLPGMNGVELLERIRSGSPGTICIMVSAVSDAQFAVDCMQKGALDYLVKPISKENLLISLGRAITLNRQIEKRRLAERQLRESEELHRIILSQISDAVFITDEAGRFTYVCPNVDTIFKRSKQDVESLGKITGILGREIWEGLDQETLTEIQNVEQDIVDGEGRTHHLLVNIKKVSIRRGRLLFTCRDVTRYKSWPRTL